MKVTELENLVQGITVFPLCEASDFPTLVWRADGCGFVRPSGNESSPLIKEKTNRDLPAIHDVEGVYDIVESKTHGFTSQFPRVDFANTGFPTRFKESAR